MALFGKKKDLRAQAGEKTPAAPKRVVKAKVKEKTPAVVKTPAPSGKKGVYAAVLRSPRITEKASMHMERGVYVFLVAPHATKNDIGKAIQETYGVFPRKINMTKIPAKIIISGRRVRGVKPGGKKAYVYLRAGEKIEVV